MYPEPLADGRRGDNDPVMVNSVLTDLEEAAPTAVQEVLTEYTARLSQVGLRAEPKGVERVVGPQGVDSEVSLLVFREGDVVDALVFMLCLGGKVCSDVDHLKADVVEQLDALLLA
jgi:hypothetical protein